MTPVDRSPEVVRVRRRSVEFDVDPRGYESFWQWFASDWEEETFEILERFVTPETTYVDVGAWIGPTLLTAATRAGRAIGYEADPVAFARLDQNIALNPDLASRVTAVHAAVSPRSGTTRLGSATTPGDSMSSVLFGGGASHWTVPAVRLPEEAADRGWTAPIFVKCDIEGGEYSLLPSLAPWIAASKPTLFVSFHPEFALRAAAQGQELHVLQHLGQSCARIAAMLGAYRHLWGADRTPLAAADLTRIDTVAACRYVVASDQAWA